MTKKIHIALLLLVGLGLFCACYRKVCPAYYSAFIVSDSMAYNYFSPFNTIDSMPLPKPKIRKNKYGLMVNVNDKQRWRNMPRIKRKKIYPIPKPTDSLTNKLDTLIVQNITNPQDSIAVQDDILQEEEPLDDILQEEAPLDDILQEEEPLDDVAEDDVPEPKAVVDSLANLDSLGAPMYRYGYRPDDNFNVEQVLYNQRFGHLFVRDSIVDKAVKTKKKKTKCCLTKYPKPMMNRNILKIWKKACLKKIAWQVVRSLLGSKSVNKK